MSINQINEVTSTLEGSGTMPLIVINANRFIRPVVSEITRELASFTDNVRIIFKYAAKEFVS